MLPEVWRRSRGTGGLWHRCWEEHSLQRPQAKEDNSVMEEAVARLCAWHICGNLENARALLGMALKSAASVRGVCQRGGTGRSTGRSESPWSSGGGTQPRGEESQRENEG